jgi:hypothetical protein
MTAAVANDAKDIHDVSSAHVAASIPPMLHDPTRHESLHHADWDGERALQAIAAIADDAESAFRGDRYWPLHALDRDPADADDHVGTCLYYGAAGVIWALQHLHALGAVALRRDYRPWLEGVLERNRQWLGQDHARDRASYLMGDTAIRMMRYLHAGDAEDERELSALLADHADHPARELMWGAPGSLLAAWFLHEHTGESCWAERFRALAADLWQQRAWSPAQHCLHWPQQLYGRAATYLGAVHGFASTVLPIVRGFRLLDEDAGSAWRQCIVDTLHRTVEMDHGLANWPPQLGPAASQKRLMQVCHGAPGIVIAVADLVAPELDSLLYAAGEAIWRAGPLNKGANLCHGTGGNGYAFLKLYRRSGDGRWLDRARAFAMHGIRQVHADAARHGQGRYSLWTGDLGFACFLWDCMHGEARFPTLDVFHVERAP